MTSGPSKGSARPGEPHKSQCEPPAAALPLPALPTSGLLDVGVIRLQIPPNLPVRTSSASMETGATSADNTARKLRNAAKRTQMDWGLQG